MMSYRATIDGFREDPTNANATLHNQAVCVMCPIQWYYPDGRIIDFDVPCGRGTFLRNRGPYEVVNGQKFYVSFVDGAVHQKEVVSVVSYPVLPIL